MKKVLDECIDFISEDGWRIVASSAIGITAYQIFGLIPRIDRFLKEHYC